MVYDKEKHKDAITFSDLPILFHLDSQTSPKMLMAIKRGEKEKKITPELKKIMHFGSVFEDVTLNWLRCCGIHVFDIPCTIIDGIGGTPDGMFIKDGEKYIVEVKWRTWHGSGPNPYKALLTEVKPKHYVQLQAYLNFFDIKEGLLMDCTISHGMRVTRYKKDPVFWKEAEERMKTFLHYWKNNLVWPRTANGVKKESEQFVLKSLKKSFIEEVEYVHFPLIN